MTCIRQISRKMDSFPSLRATLRRATLAAAALTLLSPAAANADIIAGIYNDSLFTQCGASVESCTTLLKAVPAGKVLVVTRVACQIAFATTAKVSGLNLYRGNQSQYLAPMSFISTTNGTNYYLLNAEALMAYKAGDRPAVKISFWDVTASPRLVCSVHGTIKAAS